MVHQQPSAFCWIKSQINVRNAQETTAFQVGTPCSPLREGLGVCFFKIIYINFNTP
jgi:hypothetical protein